MSSQAPAAVQITAVSDRRSLDDFIEVPWAIYANDPHWVPPLRLERRQALARDQPFSQHADWQAFVAYRDGQPIARISAQVDRLHQERYHDRTGFFGFLEAPDDPAVFKALFATAEAWLRERGMTRVRGPFSLNVNQETGLLVEGFETPPYLMMGHAPRYYEARLREQGYVGVKDLLAYEVDVPFVPSPTLKAMLARQAGQIRIRPFDGKRKAAELEVLRDLFNDAWSENWSFVPFTEAEFAMIGKELLPLIPPDFIQIAEIDGEPVAFMAFMPNINEVISDLDGRLLPFGWAKLLWRLKVRFPRSVRVSLMGVRKRFHHTRMGPTLAYGVIDAGLAPALRMGVKRAEMSWILEDNQGMRGIIEALGGVVTKRYRMFDKDLE
ncbi:MAG: hypothetical protein NW204_00305 [Xanthomonadaceae bacterium]|nr:hypothetical protein [Xanthomonadaceae bacterium]